MAAGGENGWAGMRDGVVLRTHAWATPTGTSTRGVVLLVHGLGEHAGRYAHVARQLNDHGFAVHAHDQFGHGESPGKRGTLSTPTRLLDDLADWVDRVRATMAPAQPLLLLGHSMGGAVAADFVAQRIREVQGLMLSSPALDAGMNRAQRALAAVLARLAPDFTIGNGLRVEKISHDPAEVAAYRADPRVHDRVSGRLAHYIASAGPRVLNRAGRWSVPTLLLYAGADALVDPAGSRRFAAAAPAVVVAAREFPAHYHEIFNEIERAPVFDALHAWLDARFP
jgi:alpha-beta hydrolase superfamily lysophospholipase